MEELVGSRLYCCFKCRNVVAIHDHIVAKNFVTGGGRRGFLFSGAMNVVEGPIEQRRLISGVHIVADVYCSDCREKLGWKYERAYDDRNKFKEGKFVFDLFKITKARDPPFYY